MIGSTIKIVPKIRKIENKIVLSPVEPKKKIGKINYTYYDGMQQTLDLIFCTQSKLELEVFGISNIKILSDFCEVTLLLGSETYGTTILDKDDFLTIARHENLIFGVNRYLTFYPTQISEESDVWESKTYDLINDSVLCIGKELQVDQKKFDLNGYTYLGNNLGFILLQKDDDILTLNSDLEIVENLENLDVAETTIPVHEEIQDLIQSFQDPIVSYNFDFSTCIICDQRIIYIYRFKDNQYNIMNQINFSEKIIKAKLNELGNCALVQTSQKLYLLK